MAVKRCDRCFGKFDDTVQEGCDCIAKAVVKPVAKEKAKVEVKP